MATAQIPGNAVYQLVIINSLVNGKIIIFTYENSKIMKYQAYLRIILIILMNTAGVLGQKKDKTVKARAAYEAGEYAVAADLFKDAYNKVSDKEVKNEIIFLIAECYRITDAPDKAEIRYKQAIQKEYPNPIIYLRYADALRMNEDYDDALEQYRKYKELVPDDPRGQDGIQSCELAIEWMNNPTPYNVESVKFFDTKEKDFSPYFGSDDYQLIYFTSSREEAIGNDIHGATSENFSDIFQSRMDRKGKWSVPVPLDENINSEFEDGTPFLNEDFSRMYFTRSIVNKNKNFGCQIYSATSQGETWSKAEPLKITEDSIVVAHPALTSDELTLYFVSDMAGGIGGEESLTSHQTK